MQSHNLGKLGDIAFTPEVHAPFWRFGELAEEVRGGHPVVVPVTMRQHRRLALYWHSRGVSTHQLSSTVSLRYGRSVPETNVSTSMTYRRFRS